MRRIINSGRRYNRNPTEKWWSGSPNRLPPELRDLWNRTFNNARTYYTGHEGFATGTAWHAVEWASRRVTNPKRSLPNPGDMIVLGKLLEYVSVERAPALTVVRFGSDAPMPRVPNNGPVRLFNVGGTQPELLWSDEEGLLLAIPGARLPPYGSAACQPVDRRSNAAREYRMWSKQEPACSRPLRIRNGLPLYLAGPADTVVYRSSKWTNARDNPKGSQEYIHQFGRSVGVEIAPSDAAFVFRGGKLDVIGAGIIN